MFRLLDRALVLCILAASHVTAIPFDIADHTTDITAASRSLDAREIQKRDLAADICGSADSLRSADENRNQATWNAYKVGDWYQNAVKPYVVGNWTNGPTKFPDIQQVIIKLMGEDGVQSCDEITNPVCDATGRDWPLCNQHPEAHFVFIALTNWANFLNKLHQTLLDSTVSLTALTGTLREQFYTPAEDPSELLVPVGIVSGIAGAISGFYGPVAIVAGAGAIINAVITQAGLDQVDPITQWAAAQAAIGSAFTQVTTAQEWVFDHTLKELPDEVDNPITYDVDPTQTPEIFAGGSFGGPVEVGAFNKGIYGAMAASAVNALWAQDGVFIMKISDATYGKGDGAACKAYPIMTVCSDDGKTAYIWMRWQMQGGIALDNAVLESYLDPKKWNVWGAYAQGTGAEGAENANHLEEYKLDLKSLTTSAIKTFDENGFPFTNQNGATIEHLKSDPTDLNLADLLYISLPVCDMDAVLGGKHLKDPDDKTGDNPIVRWGACSCGQYDKWPGKTDVYKVDTAGYTTGDCQDKGWAS